MFRKRKNPVRENTESQAAREQIRRRMAADVAGSKLPLQATARREGGQTLDAIASQYPVLPGQAPSYDAAQQHLTEAMDVSRAINQVSRETTSNAGRWSISAMLRSSLRWYTAPEEAYWAGTLGSMDRILAALRAHDVVMQSHANAVRDVQEMTATLTRQLSEVFDATAPELETPNERSEL